MSLRQRAVAAGAALAIHLLMLGPLADSGSTNLAQYFWGDAEAVLDGDRPYGDRGFEYPPLAIPVTVASALPGDSPHSYEVAFAWEMIGFDLAIVLMLAFGLGGDRRRVAGALTAYTLGILFLTGIGPLPASHLEKAPLPLARFDLVPGALALAAVLARTAGRSATWSAMLGLGAAVKAFPAILYPVLLRGERSLRRVIVAGLVPLAVAAALVLVLDDGFGSAISYHAGRELQIESLGASPILIADLLGAEVGTEFSSGSLNVVGGGAELLRALSLVVLVALYLLLVVAAWRSRAPLPEAATAALAIAVVFAPVLSPQFLLWLLPVSTAAYGLRLPNLVLLGAIVLTGYVLAYYGGAPDIETRFVLAQCARNAALLAYAALVVVPLLRRDPLPRPAAAGLPV